MTKTQKTTRQQIIDACEAKVLLFELAEKAFKAEAEEYGVLTAVEQATERIAKARPAYYRANLILEQTAGLTDTEAVAWVKTLIENDKKRFRGFHLTQSTNPLHNFIENIAIEAEMQMMFNDHGGLYDTILTIIKDAE